MAEPSTLPAHVAWLLPSRGAMLAARLEREGVDLDVEAALAVLVEADPSPGANAVQWLCDTYLVGGLRWEDVMAGAGSQTAQTLRLYAQHRRALPHGQRNLDDYGSLADVHAALAPLLEEVERDDTVSGRAARRELRDRVRADSIMVHQSPELIVAIPTTREAAVWWGRGTQWCTAADNSNMFEEYNEISPLLVIALPGVPGGKMQLHLDDGNGDIQFMDQHDRPVSKNLVARHWARLQPLMEWAVGHNGAMLRYVPTAHRTAELCRRAVDSNGWSLGLVPARLRTAKICTLAVSRSAQALEHVPMKLRSREMCIIAVEAVGALICHVPKRMLDEAICLAAVQQNGALLAWIPPARRTLAVCTAAVQHSGYALDDVPYEFMSSHMCNLALGARLNGGRAIRFFNAELIDAEVCARAVRSSPEALADIPPCYRTPELYLSAVGVSGDALRLVPRHDKSPEIIEAALRKDGMALMHVPEDMLTPEMCAIAVQTTPRAIRRVPREYASLELCKLAVLADPLVVQSAQRVPQLRELYPMALGMDGMALGRIAYRDLTPELCALAVQQNPDAMQYVPKDMQSGSARAMGQKTYMPPRPAWMDSPMLSNLLESMQGVGNQRVEIRDAAPLTPQGLG